jgi:osmotically-inducible protein OsmY
MRIIKIIGFLLCSFNLVSCAPVFLAGGSAIVGGSAIEERTLGTQINDKSIWGKIVAALAKENKGYSDITVEVNEGRVLLIGQVSGPEDRLEILRIVWKQQGVSEVINEIQIGEDAQTFKNLATDTWITTQIKSKLLFARDVKSVNYSVETINSVVYLIGIAQNDAELDAVTSIASKVKYVTQVVSYVRLKDSKIRQNKHNL